MGGVAGHMDHLYDNPNLTFIKMKEIMEAASNGELDTEEKVDGQNLFLSYSIPEGKAKGARNKGNLKEGGLDAAGLAHKFAGRGGLEKAFTGGFSAFEKAIEALAPSEKRRLFGPDTNIWYNAEIMDPGTEGNLNDPGATNVIKYDDKTLKIHDVGHFIFDRETGEKSPTPKGTVETLDNALERMQQSLHGHDFSLARRAIINLQKLEDDEALSLAKSRIDSALAAEGLNDSSTIHEYVFTRLRNGIDAEMSEEYKKELVKYLMGIKGNIGKLALKKGLSPEDVQELEGIIQHKKMLLKEAIEPIEMAVHHFTVAVLRGLESVFIADNKAEVERLKNEVAAAVKAITAKGPENPHAMEIMQRHLNKIKDFSQITTPVEAVVFDYDGHTYKFAGNFAPLNQILGMFKYPKGGKSITSENINFGTEILTDAKGKRVALLPGGFKPPHAGHYELAKYLASEPDIDEVVVIIGKSPRFDEDGKISVTAEQSKYLWELYTRKDNNIKVRTQTGKTPVADVYDLIADPAVFSEGDTVILGKSDKDEGDTRFARAQSYAERNNPGVNVEERVMKQFGGEGMGGTALRNLIADNKKNMFITKLPNHLNKADLEEAWNIVFHGFNESLNNIIDSALKEISSMSGGSNEGSAGMNGFGPSNKFNPWRQKTRKTTKKPKIKKAKRQRRR